MAALAYSLPHDPDRPEDHGPYLLPDGPARGGRRAGPVGGQPGAARPQPPARPTRPLRTARAAGLYWRRRLLVAAGLALGVWLTAAAVGGLTTALRGLESRPLTAPELAGAGQLAAASTPLQASAAGTTAAPRAGQSYVVQPGDTLWQIARHLQPAGDIRPLVDRLAKLAGRGPLQIGERLVLP